MTTISKLNQELLALVAAAPRYNGQLVDFHFKSKFEEYQKAIAKTHGRKFTVFATGWQDLASYIRPLMLVSDQIVFNTEDYSPSPTIGIFPVSDKIRSPVLGLAPAADMTEAGTLRYRTPTAKEYALLMLYSVDKENSADRSDILGFEWGRPSNCWQRSQFTRTSDVYGKRSHLAVGFCYEYPEALYDWLFGEARQLLKTGKIAFAPFIRSTPDAATLDEPMLKADLLKSTLIVRERELLLADGTRHLFETIQIPYLESVPLPTLSKIISDEGESLKAFRRDVDRAMEDISELTDPVAIAKEMKRFRRDVLEDEMSRVEAICRKVIRMKSLVATGATIMTTAVTIAGMTGLATPPLIVSAAAGGAAAINQLWQAYEEKKSARRSSMYFAWQLQRAATT